MVWFIQDVPHILSYSFGSFMTFFYIFLVTFFIILYVFLILCIFYHYVLYKLSSGSGSSVGIATGYGLDGPGIEFRWGRDFPHLPRPALGPTQPPVQWVPVLSRGEEIGRGVTLTNPLLVTRSKTRVELSLYSSDGPSGPVKRGKPTYKLSNFFQSKTLKKKDLLNLYL
jgi:hypothetical protein